MFTHGSASLQLFPVVWIFLRSPWVSFVTTDEFSVRVTKIASGIGVSWTHSLPFYFSLFKACVCYFSLFLKDKCVLCYFERSTLKRNITYSSFSFPLFHKHLFSPGLPRTTHLLETSWLETITVCVIETMLVTLPLVQMNKARREVNRTNHVQTKINIMKGLQTSVIHLIPGSTCHWISNRMRYFLKNIFWSKHFPATTNCRSRHSRVFLVKPVLKIS